MGSQIGSSVTALGRCDQCVCEGRPTVGCNGRVNQPKQGGLASFINPMAAISACENTPSSSSANESVLGQSSGTSGAWASSDGNASHSGTQQARSDRPTRVAVTADETKHTSPASVPAASGKALSPDQLMRIAASKAAAVARKRAKEASRLAPLDVAKGTPDTNSQTVPSANNPGAQASTKANLTPVTGPRRGGRAVIKNKRKLVKARWHDEHIFAASIKQDLTHPESRT